MTSHIDLTFLFKNLMGFKNGVPKEHINSSSSTKNSNANGSSSKQKRSRRLQQQKDNNNVTVTTTTTTSIDNNKVLKLFESIPSETMNQLAILYKNDLKLWQELLDHGTPRSSPGEEITLYDYYIIDQNQKKY